VCASLIVGSLLAVVIGDAMVAQGQVALSNVQAQVAAATAVQKAGEVDVSFLAAPARVVSVGLHLGLTPAPTVAQLPAVPLSVPLPAPDTAPVAK
jgi:hypothetical protein